MNADIVILDGTVVSPEGLVKADVVVSDGKIAALLKDASGINSDRVIKASGKLILPGAIDPHVHFRDPGFTHKEDFYTGTSAAAAGGVCTVMDMPNNSPLIATVEAFMAKKADASKKAVVDFCLIAAAGPGNIAQIPSLAQVGAVYFKTIMGGYTPEERPETAGMLALRNDDLLRIFLAASAAKRIVAVHAESEELRQYFIAKVKSEGGRDFSHYVQSRPNVVEEEAVSRAILLAREARCRLHIAHVSTGKAVGLIKEARRENQQVTFETCPHYLLLTSEDVQKLGPAGIMNPPLRSAADREALWNAIRNDEVPFLSTDHAPHTEKEKSLGFTDVFRTPAGITGVETFLPLMLSEALKGTITLEQLVRLTSTNAAVTFGLFPDKGIIQVGADADLVIADPKSDRKITEESLHSKSKVTPFIGWQVKGTLTHTFVRGELVMENNEILAKPGVGKFIRPLQSG